jgi:hypothetical protein
VVKERCLRCNASWERGPNTARHACPLCGEPKWDQEFDLGDSIGARNQYEIIGERIDSNQILTLELRGVNFSHAPVAQLSHRLKSMYRHQKADLGAKDGRGLVVVFEQVGSGPQKGLWVIQNVTRKRE